MRLHMTAPLVAVICFFCFVAGVAQASSCPEGLLLEAGYYVTPSHQRPVCVVAGDWNEDGKNDVAVGNQTPPSISIFLGEGDFSFLPRHDIALGAQPYWLSAQDMNHDGHTDLIATGSFGTAILLGTGHGDFELEPVLPYYGYCLGVADLNGDSFADLALATDQGTTVILLHGTTPVSVSTAPKGGRTLALGDLNEDGYPDILTAGGGLLVCLNNGDGTFGPPAIYTENCDFDMGWDCVATGDVDGDHHLDIIGVSSDPGRCSPVWLGDGHGGFRNTWWAVHSPAGVSSGLSAAGRSGNGPVHVESGPTGSHFVLMADLNRDDHAETIQLNDMDGYEVGCGDPFNGAQIYRSLPYPRMATVANIDGDGNPDVIVAAAAGIAVHPGVGDGRLRRNVALRMWPPEDPQLCDINGDGINDLIVTGHEDVTVVLGLPDGGLGQPIFASERFNLGRACVDIDGDDHPDLIVGGDILPGRGDGTFAGPGYHYADSRIVWVSTGDVNSDGHVDLAVVRDDTVPGALFLGHGDGTFDPPLALDLQPRQLWLYDVDRDGRLDVVAQTLTGGIVAFGDGTGHFVDRVDLPGSSAWPVPFAFADVDGDGQIDILQSGAAFRNLGRAFVRIDEPFTADYLPLAVADLNLDGHPDVVTGDGQVWLGDGGAKFHSWGSFGPGGATLVDDRNRDGRPDLIILRTDNSEYGEGSATMVFNHPPACTDWTATPTLVMMFEARRTSGGILIRWQTAPTIANDSVQIERADQVSGPWGRLLESRSIEAGVVVELDRKASPGRAYWYRLVEDNGQGIRVLGPAIEVTPSLQVSFALGSVSPNPSSHSIHVEFEVPRPAAVQLDLYDILGRHVASLTRGVLQPGNRHISQWSWEGWKGTAPCGVYLLRYRYPGGQDSRVVVHSH